MTRLIVMALGGNALAPAGESASIANQFRHARESIGPIVRLARDGWQIVIVHGNGPQVGDELRRHELSRREVEPLPLGVLVAATAGWIGYMLQQSLQNGLADAGMPHRVVTLVTQTLVDYADPALGQPSKPIGHSLSDREAAALAEWGFAVGRDGGGKMRRLAVSPRPVEVVEAGAVQRLLEDKTIVIAGGGGGAPVYRHPILGLEGVDAVVDKDLTAMVLGHALGADVLLILTDVDAVYQDWQLPSRRPLRRMSVEQAAAMLDSGELGAGSMAPKVRAAMEFVQGGGNRAIIARLSDGPAALRGDAGTTIARNE